MKKILLALILLFPIAKVSALNCSYSDLAYLKKLASNINYTYKYNEYNGNVTFSVTLTNLQNNLYIVDKTKNTTYSYTGSEITIDNYTSGQVVKYDIYTNSGDCTDQILYSIALTLPTYNPYYNDELCSTIPNYELCQKWSTHGLTYEKFQSSVSSYLNNLKIEEENKNKIENNEDDIWQPIIDFILKYYYIPLSVIIVGGGIAIYIINKKSNIYN